MIRTAEQIRADLIAAGEVDWLPESDPSPSVRAELRDEPPVRSVAGVTAIDIDMGVGRLMAGWDDVRRHARIWTDEPPPDVPRVSPFRQDCPSEGAYRRHLKAREQCPPCREHVRKLERQRKGRPSRR
jgi:hypothetical protein